MSIISHSWLKQCLPGCDILDMAELVGLHGLELKAANGTDLPYEGWVELTFNLIEDGSDHPFTVPFLIAKDFLDMPIVGFNVIKEITKHFDRGSLARVNGSLDVLTSSLTGFEQRKVEALVQFITSEPAKELAAVKSRKQDIVFHEDSRLLFHVALLSVQLAKYRYCLKLIQTIRDVVVLRYLRHRYMWQEVPHLGLMSGWIIQPNMTSR